MRDDRHELAAKPLQRAGLPLPQAAIDLQADPFAPLLQAAAAAPASAASGSTSSPLRRQILTRVARSAAAAREMHTLRIADTVLTQPAPGVTQRQLYRASAAQARRPGEPDAVALVELAPGATWAGPESTLQREWLVLRGSLRIGATPLHEHDYHVVPAGQAAGAWAGAGGALLYQREAEAGPGAPAAPWTQRSEAGAWDDYGPGIKRRMLWQQQGQGAMLYHAVPGAAVPHHGHRHDEECLMLAGDFFLDEVLLRKLDYQIAPAGTEHQLSFTDTGLVVFAHGDVELDLR